MSNSTHHNVNRGVTPLRVRGDLTSTTYLEGSAIDGYSGPVMLLSIGLHHDIGLWIRDLDTLDRLSAAIEQARTAFLNLDTDELRKVG
ncbi:hypothetical protein ABN034_07645 [Actinopolymorpha sp. B11F2]|uniref:hypothetical protein n=1 Tax=Actinopolymorpha sp. B11F2 TaxID=3160862 RepID=UPI0032E43DDF